MLVREGRGLTGDPDQLAAHLFTDQAPRIARLQQRALTAAQRREVRKFLFTAWNAEAVARLSMLLDQDVRQFTNQWKPVQCYYAIYFHLVAMHFIVQGTVQKKHE